MIYFKKDILFKRTLKEVSLFLSRILIVFFALSISNSYINYSLENTIKEIIEKEDVSESSDAKEDIENFKEDLDKIINTINEPYLLVPMIKNKYIFNLRSKVLCWFNITIPPPEV